MELSLEISVWVFIFDFVIDPLMILQFLGPIVTIVI